MRCFTRAFLGFAAALWFTLAFAPRVRQALIAYSEHSLPKPDYVAPKYAIGGRYVTKEEFDLYDAYRRGEITRKEWSDATFTNLAARPDWGIPA